MNTEVLSVVLEDLVIPSTPETPEVKCIKNTGEIILIGNLIAHDPKDFFSPLLNWFEAYVTCYNPQKITLHLYLTFINGCSEHYVGVLMKRLEKLYQNGLPVKVYCHYESEDIDMRDWGLELKEILRLPIEMIEIN